MINFVSILTQKLENNGQNIYNLLTLTDSKQLSYKMKNCAFNCNAWKQKCDLSLMRILFQQKLSTKGLLSIGRVHSEAGRVSMQSYFVLLKRLHWPFEVSGKKMCCCDKTMVLTEKKADTDVLMQSHAGEFSPRFSPRERISQQ